MLYMRFSIRWCWSKTSNQVFYEHTYLSILQNSSMSIWDSYNSAIKWNINSLYVFSSWTFFNTEIWFIFVPAHVTRYVHLERQKGRESGKSAYYVANKQIRIYSKWHTTDNECKVYFNVIPYWFIFWFIHIP